MFCIYKTDPDWISVVRTLQSDTQVNFWRRNTNALSLPIGSWFYFSQRRSREIVGRGIFVGYEIQSVDRAWQLYGVGNGVRSLSALRSRAAAVLKVDSLSAEIGCIILSELEFLRAGETYIISNSDYARSIVGPKYFGDVELTDLHSRFVEDPEPSLNGVVHEPEVTYHEGGSFFSYRRGYERNPEARRQCLAHHGFACAACGLVLEKRYGTAARELIHVHHLFPLSDTEGPHAVSPISDLVPLCPNCHAVAHRKVPPFTIEEMKVMLSL